MSSHIGEDGIFSPTHLEDTESPRKRPRMDNSSRMSWSLMDRRTDQEVLQEMGVSLLEPDDNELCEANTGLHHKPPKRKRDIENVNPNACLPRKGKPSPGAGPSRLRSPRSCEKARPLQPTDSQLLETTFIESYLVDEETPLGQVTAAHGYSCLERKQTSSTPAAAGCASWWRRGAEPAASDSFNILSDEMILSVFRWLPKRTLAHCMLVCKRWQAVASDETLWQRLDLGNKTLNKDALGRILDRKPIIVRLASSEIGEWHPPSPPTPSRVQYLDLSVAAIDRSTLASLLARCPRLKKLSLESVGVDDDVCGLIGKCVNMETLNLTMAQGITEVGLTSILEGCTSLQALNISWCNLSTEALEVLVTGLPQKLQRLNVAGARILTDDMVHKLVTRCPRLLELDLSDCSLVGAAGVAGVQTLPRLEHLALSRCYLLPPHVLTKLSCMVSLVYLEVWGMLHAASLSALRAALPAIQLNQFMFSAIARPTVGTRRTSIWGLRTRD